MHIHVHMLISSQVIANLIYTSIANTHLKDVVHGYEAAKGLMGVSASALKHGCHHPEPVREHARETAHRVDI